MRPKHIRTFSEAPRTALAQVQQLFVTALADFRCLFAAFAMFGLSFSTHAQMPRSRPELPQAAPRVTAVVDDAVLVPLAGNTHAPARQRFDGGRVASGVPTGKMRLVLSRGPEGDRRLREFLGNVQDPHSPRYHQWLTPQGYGAAFGVADQDLEQVKRWLTRQGFKVERVAVAKNFVEFSGAVGNVERAFHAGMHTYTVEGVQHFANSRDPMIPAALAPVIKGVSLMNNFRAIPQGALRGSTQARRSTVSGAAPSFVNATDHTLYLTPADAATLYDSPNPLNKNFKGGSKWTGAGVNIGIAGYSDLAVADYLNYRRLFLNETSPMQPNVVKDGVDPGVENQHDGQITLIGAEIASALAPGAQLYVYSSKSDILDDGLTDAIARAIEDNLVSILSVSYARCEYVLGDSGNAEINELWQQAAAQGISVVVAAGDTGSAGCDESDESSATGGLAVNGLASPAYDLAVGGTDLDVLAQGFGTFVDSNIGTSAPTQAAVNGFIPENPWNDAITDNPPGVAASNTAGTYDFGAGPTTLITAGGGGISSTISCTGGVDPASGNCLAYSGYPVPPYQSGLAPGTPSDVFPAARYLPDIALFAGDGRQYPVVWAICSDNAIAQSSSTFTDCAPGPDGTFSVEGAGGTGAAASAAAGMLAVLSESLGGSRLGIVNNTLYNLYAGSTANSIFHDVTAGNTSVPCTADSLNCGGNGFLTGYDAAPGYDLTTGMGSLDLSQLIAAWPSASFEATNTSLLVDGGSTLVSIVHGDPVNLSVTVTAPGTTATGTASVTAVADQNAPNQLFSAVAENVALVNGAGSTTTQKIPGGTYDLQAYYPGDATHSPSTSGPIEITVNSEPSSLQLLLRVADVNTSQALGSTFPYGSFGFAYVQPTSASGDFHGPATGQVTLRNNSTPFSSPGGPSGQVLNSAGRAAFPLAQVAPGTYQLSATYDGDSSYKPSSTAGSTAVTIIKGPTTLTVSPGSASLDASATETVTVTLMTDSTGDYPSGGITLNANGTSFPGSVHRVFTKINSVELIETFQVKGSALTSGSNTLTATYPGDMNYASSTAGTAVTVTGGSGSAFTLTGPMGGMAIAAAQAQTSGTVAISSTGGFAGVVKLSCSLSPAAETVLYQCTVPPSVVLPAGTSANATVTISTTTSTASTGDLGRSAGPKSMQLRLGKAGLILCSGFLVLVPTRRRFGLLILTAAALLGTLGCGIQVTPIKGITAVVTGTSGSTTATLNIPIKIQ